MEEVLYTIGWKVNYYLGFGVLSGPLKIELCEWIEEQINERAKD